MQPLPPLTLPTPERRAGLPEVTGPWRFVSFALPPVQDTLAPPPNPAEPGPFVITTQRLDSLAGYYLSEGGRVPLVGEVRRDGVVSLAAFAAEGGRFAAGRVVRDTLWIELTSFGVADSWPRGTRAAFSRNPPPPPPVPQDTLPRDTLAAAGDTVRQDTVGVPATPGVTTPATPGVVAPPVATPARPPTAVPPGRVAPRPASPLRPVNPAPTIPTPRPAAPDSPPPTPPDTTPPAR